MHTLPTAIYGIAAHMGKSISLTQEEGGQSYITFCFKLVLLLEGKMVPNLGLRNLVISTLADL